jgi:hypothetical protein
LCCTEEKEQRTKIGGHVSLWGAKVARTAKFNGAAITGDLNLIHADIGENLKCHLKEGHRTEIGGKVCLSGAKVAGEVDFRGAFIRGDLELQGADIGASLFCGPMEGKHTEIAGKAWLVRVKVAGQADFRGTVIKGEGDKAKDPHLNLQSARIASAFLDGRTAEGSIFDLSLAQFTHLEIVWALPKTIKAMGLKFEEICLPGKKKEKMEKRKPNGSSLFQRYIANMITWAS